MPQLVQLIPHLVVLPLADELFLKGFLQALAFVLGVGDLHLGLLPTDAGFFQLQLRLGQLFPGQLQLDPERAVIQAPQELPLPDEVPFFHQQALHDSLGLRLDLDFSQGPQVGGGGKMVGDPVPPGLGQLHRGGRGAVLSARRGCRGPIGGSGRGFRLLPEQVGGARQYHRQDQKPVNFGPFAHVRPGVLSEGTPARDEPRGAGRTGQGRVRWRDISRFPSGPVQASPVVNLAGGPGGCGCVSVPAFPDSLKRGRSCWPSGRFKWFPARLKARLA